MASLAAMNEIGRYVFLALLLLLVSSVIWLTARILLLCRHRGLAVIKTEDRALSPSSLQTVVLLFATLLGGLWVAFTVVITGSLELQQLSMQEAKLRHVPNIKIDMEVESFSPITFESKVTIPLHIQISVENQGLKTVPLKFDQVPLLLITKIDGSSTEEPTKMSVSTLPYVKLKCEGFASCSVSRWTRGSLESGGTGYYSFLHPGLSPGLYYLQFQLPVPLEVWSEGADFDRSNPVLWTRARYFDVRAEAGLGMRGSASARSGSL